MAERKPIVKSETIATGQIIGTIEGDWLPKDLLSKEDQETVIQQVNLLSGYYDSPFSPKKHKFNIHHSQQITFFK